MLKIKDITDATNINPYLYENNQLQIVPNIFVRKHDKLNPTSISNLERKKKLFFLWDKEHSDLKNFSGRNRHFVPGIIEWSNSIYAFKKDRVKLSPALSKSVFNLIKGYLNFYNVNKNKDARSWRARVRNRRYSFNRVMVAKPNIKHTNKHATVVVYLYNRRQKYLSNKIGLMDTIDNISSKNYRSFIYNLKNNFSPIHKYKKLFTNRKYTADFAIVNNNLINSIKKHMSVELNTIILKQLIFIENSKFNKHYLAPLKGLIEIIYKKKVLFSFVNLKHIYNSAGVLSESIVTKIRRRKSSAFKILSRAFDMFKLPYSNKFVLLQGMYEKNIHMQNVMLNNISHLSPRYSKFLPLLSTSSKNNIFERVIKDENINNYVNNIYKAMTLVKHRFSTGLRIEIAGRLTKRNTADRSMYKARHIGNLKDSDSSLKNLSATLLRGFSKSSVRYVQSKSRIRVGSFGVKTWVNAN